MLFLRAVLGDGLTSSKLAPRCMMRMPNDEVACEREELFLARCVITCLCVIL